MLLDAETYDYMFQVRRKITLIKKIFLPQVKASEGFKMSVQHHLDQPLMQINEIDISPGFQTQVCNYIYNLTELMDSLIRSQ